MTTLRGLSKGFRPQQPRGHWFAREGRHQRLNEKTLTLCFDLAAAGLSSAGALGVWVLLLGLELLWWYPAVLVVLSLVWVTSLASCRALSYRLHRSLLDDLPIIVGRVLCGSMVIALGVALAGRDLREANLVVLVASFGVLAVPVARGFSYALCNKRDESRGPRPEQPTYVELFENSVYRYAHRHRIKSGITGWAQVNGLREDTSIEERVLFDNYYIENWSLWLDIKIIVLTLFKAGISKPERNGKVNQEADVSSWTAIL